MSELVGSCFVTVLRVKTYSQLKNLFLYILF